MSTADLKPVIARLQLGSRNAPFETEMTRLLKRDLVSISLMFEPSNALKWIELRRPRDEAVLARLVNLDEDREKLVEIHSDFIDALKREGLNPLNEDGLIIPVRGGEEIVSGVIRALESSLKRIDDQATGDQVPQDSVSALWDLLAREAGSIEAPSDWSAEHDHYLYGTPKRGDEGKE